MQNSLIETGWIKLHRKFTEWEWYTDLPTFKLFIHLLLRANHSPTKWRGIPIGEGQLLSGRKALSMETGLSEQQVRTALAKLVATSEITTTPEANYSIITITNWSLYQSTNQQINQASTKHQPSINQASTTDKNEKNNKNEKNIDLCEQVKNLWNEKFEGKLVELKLLSEKRVKLINARTAELKAIEDWQRFFGLIAASRFLTGQATSWKASFDWCLKKENFIKIIEGNYANVNNKPFANNPAKPTKKLNIMDM